MNAFETWASRYVIVYYIIIIVQNYVISVKGVGFVIDLLLLCCYCSHVVCRRMAKLLCALSTLHW